MNMSLTKQANDMAKLPILESRKAFDKLEQTLLALPQLSQAEMPTTHYFAGGMYGRRITIPRGAMITGRIYKFDHFEIMLEGDITIYAADGGKKRYTGFNIIEAKAGKRQAGKAHEDTTWLTINRSVKAPEECMLDNTSCRTYREYEGFHRRLNILDYQQLLSDLGMTQEEMDLIYQVNDVVDMPQGFKEVYVAKSELAGSGLFTNEEIVEGETICPVRAQNNRTIAGRYTNHALYPNSKPALIAGIFCIIAVKRILEGEEITMNYRDVIKFRSEQGDLV